MTGSPNSGCGIANMSLKTRECRDRMPRCTRNCVVCAWITTFPSSSQIRVDRVAPLAVLGGSSRIVVLFRLAFGIDVGCDSDIISRRQSRLVKKERLGFERNNVEQRWNDHVVDKSRSNITWRRLHPAARAAVSGFAPDAHHCFNDHMYTTCKIQVKTFSHPRPCMFLLPRTIYYVQGNTRQIANPPTWFRHLLAIRHISSPHDRKLTHGLCSIDQLLTLPNLDRSTPTSCQGPCLEGPPSRRGTG